LTVRIAANLPSGRRARPRSAYDLPLGETVCFTALPFDLAGNVGETAIAECVTLTP